MGRRIANKGLSHDIRQLERGESLVIHHAGCNTEGSRCSRRQVMNATAQRILGTGQYATYHNDDSIEVEYLLESQVK